MVTATKVLTIKSRKTVRNEPPWTAITPPSPSLVFYFKAVSTLSGFHDHHGIPWMLAAAAAWRQGGARSRNCWLTGNVATNCKNGYWIGGGGVSSAKHLQIY